MADFDWEVKLRAMRFFISLLIAGIEGTSATASGLFLDLEGDALLLASVLDNDRLVRLEACTMMRDIVLRATKGVSPSTETLSGFLAKVKSLDFDYIASQAQPPQEDDEFLVRHVLEGDKPFAKPNILDCPF
jgi:hypothetical protein